MLKQHWYGLVLLPLTVLSDGLAVLGAYLLSYWLRSLAPNTLLNLEIYLTYALANGLSLVGVLMVLGLYRPSRREARFDESVTALLGLVLAVGLVLVGAFFVRSVSLSRLVIVYTVPLAGLALILGRLLLRSFNDWARSCGYGVRRVLILGTGTQAIETAKRLEQSPGLGYTVVGHLGLAQADRMVLGELTDLSAVLAKGEVDEVWFALGTLPPAQFTELLAVVSQRAIRVRLVPEVSELLTTNLRMDSLGGVPLLTLRETPLRYWQNRFCKRLLDLTFAGVGVALISPLLLGIALWVKRTSPGPIFYRQERLSRDGESFYIYKFRTMYVDAEASGPGWTTQNDKRVTPGGSFLRRTSLDELPQLLNVLTGDMSLVGPRPERPHYVAQFRQEIPKYFDRHLVKTGITGWAQVHGLRGDTSIPERVRYDLYYIENWSLLLDLRILLVTCWQVIWGQPNAY
ncbi:undecaprenyl-phosphate glucose phosphotransferase [Candidatus Cyanaurora vandensis]|uniref:undecaprenyl-phosphate glucose phosphotransferase n=2 Tax=Candidatus Cyanaurora vandensis TaxID=2714958 RepID=UPI00257AE7AB|nr:undecaprenyl-phosphate glucose phosphotransferase [Candidatus Cyanaurora vandensis]